MIRLTFLIPVLLLAACLETKDVSVTPAAENDAALQTASFHMSEQLKDPESLKLRRVSHFRTSEGDDIICGEMDAKNSFGGYNGYTPFYVRIRSNQVQRAFFGADAKYNAAAGCKDAAAGLIKVAA